MERKLATLAALLISLIGSSHCSAESPNANELEKTIRRYFLGQSDYHEGDLVTRSQVEQLQSYLRKTRRHSPASHPVILQRFLTDRNRLCKAFYLKNGGKVLREASKQIGGYASLEALVRDTGHYTAILQAIHSGSVEEIIKLVESVNESKSAEDREAEHSRKLRKKTIYTIDEFISVVFEEEN